MAKQPKLTTAREFYRAAAGIHDMTRLAIPHIGEKDSRQLAIYLGYYFNLGFAVELYLKAYLKDLTGDDVSSYGHDLHALVEAAIRRGFNFEKRLICDIIKGIGDKHKALEFRYAEKTEDFPFLDRLDLVDVALAACYDGMAHLR